MLARSAVNVLFRWDEFPSQPSADACPRWTVREKAARASEQAGKALEPAERASEPGEKENQSTVNTVFHFCFHSYFRYCLFLFIIDSLSTLLISGCLSLSEVFKCFVTFEAFYDPEAGRCGT